MKKNVLIITFLFLFSGFQAFASILDDCYKIFPKSADVVYMSALSALSSSSKYDISEIQSKNGYILFLNGAKYYLLTVTKRYQNQSEVKILPQNSDYSQGTSVAKNVFSLIENELKNLPMEQNK